MKNWVYTFLSLTISSHLFAQTVTLAEAEKVARNFYYERVSSTETIHYEDVVVIDHYQLGEPSNPDYFVFNIFPKGFVVVSGIRNAFPVPAYSLEGAYTNEGQPPAFIAWMKQYCDQIKYAREIQVSPYAETISTWKRLLTENPMELKDIKNEKQVLPLLISTWNQGQFYNQMCPSDPAGPGGHCVTGCVATAMGQLCYYFRFPETGTGSYTYIHPDYGTISADFENTNYRWNAMTNSVSQQNDAVAELIFHLGVSVDMDYGPDGSGMWNHKAAYSLRTYFRYSPETEYLYRDSTDLDWDSVIVAHLDQKIPMYYAGWSVPNVNGHAFIVDGYQTEDYFHFNWGWGGSYDGYFYLDNLVPGGSNFNLAQELVINCFPDTINNTYPLYCNTADTLNFLRGTIEDGSSQTEDYQNNANCSWLITPQTEEDSVSYIVLNFNKFDTELNHDLVTIYDGETSSSTILGQFSGNSLPGTLYSTGNKVLITFQTDDQTTAPGWFLSYHSIVPQWCGGLTTLTEPQDTVSDGSGHFNYQNGSACMWLIQPPGATEVTLHFEEFDTEPLKDIVKIYDAGTNQLLATYSGMYEPGNPPAPITSMSGKMFITFSSNMTVTRPGWKAIYISDGVSIDENSDFTEMFKLYPNPVSDFLMVDLNLEEPQFVIIQIYGSNGILMKQQENYLNHGKVQEKINAVNLTPGVYIVRMICNGTVYNQKIIKMN